MQALDLRFGDFLVTGTALLGHHFDLAGGVLDHALVGGFHFGCVGSAVALGARGDLRMHVVFDELDGINEDLLPCLHRRHIATSPFPFGERLRGGLLYGKLLQHGFVGVTRDAVGGIGHDDGGGSGFFGGRRSIGGRRGCGRFQGGRGWDGCGGCGCGFNLGGACGSLGRRGWRLGGRRGPRRRNLRRQTPG